MGDWRHILVNIAVKRPAKTGFPAGRKDGHHLVNRGAGDALLLEVGDRTAGDEVDYSDVDMMIRWVEGEERILRKDGTAY